MKQLHDIIKNLLLDYDCVVVPNFGAFILRNVNASYDNGKQVFYSPKKEVSFNRLITDDDGILSKTVAETLNCSVQSAEVFISHAVKEYWKDLNAGKSVVLHGLGKFKIHIRGSISFAPIEAQNFRVDMYGMFDLQVKPLFEVAPTVTLKKHSPFLFNRIAAAILFLVGMFIYTHPVSDSQRTQVAGILFPSVSIDEKIPDFEYNNSDLSAATVNDEDDFQKELDALVEDIEISEVNLMEDTEIISDTLYHVIIGSVSSIETATKALAAFNRKQIDCTMLDCGNRYRISHKSFTDKDKAFKFWKSFRKSSKAFSDSWIYIQSPS